MTLSSGYEASTGLGEDVMLSTNTKQKILVIQPMVGIGDMVWHKPWLDDIISSHHVVLMAKPSSQASAVLCDHPDLEVIPLHRAERGKKSHHDGWLGFFKLVSAMRSAKADEVWILHKSWRYAVAAIFAGIKRRAGYGFGKQRFALNLAAPLSSDLKKAHPRETAAAFCAQFRIKPKDTHPQIKPNKEMRAKAEELAPKTPYIVMGVGAADEIRRWSPKRFAGLITKLRASHPDIGIILCGSPAEAVIGDRIIDALDQNVEPPQLMFDQTVHTVIAIHERAALYIGNDTSLINIAAAVGTKAIRIFASNLPVLASPLIETHLPEDEDRIDVFGAINDIDDDRIYKAALKYFDAS